MPLQPLYQRLSLIMNLCSLVVILGTVTGSYINNDVCKTEYNTVCEEVEKPHVEHKTERKCDTVQPAMSDGTKACDFY